MWKEKKPLELKENPFEMIGKDWLLITAGTKESCNAMTASWGGVGEMWGKHVVYLVIRPQRYTKEFVDRQEQLSVCVLPDSYRSVYNYMGQASGRDEDKIAKSGLTVAFEDGVPFFQESSTVFLCRKLFAQPFEYLYPLMVLSFIILTSASVGLSQHPPFTMSNTIEGFSSERYVYL